MGRTAQPPDRQDEIRDAHIRLLQSTNRLLEQAERVKGDRDRLMELADTPSDTEAGDGE